MLILFSNVSTLSVDAPLDAPSHAFDHIVCACMGIAYSPHALFERGQSISVGFHLQDSLVCPGPLILLESMAFAACKLGRGRK